MDFKNSLCDAYGNADDRGDYNSYINLHFVQPKLKCNASQKYELEYTCNVFTSVQYVISLPQRWNGYIKSTYVYMLLHILGNYGTQGRWILG